LLVFLNTDENQIRLNADFAIRSKTPHTHVREQDPPLSDQLFPYSMVRAVVDDPVGLHGAQVALGQGAYYLLEFGFESQGHEVVFITLVLVIRVLTRLDVDVSKDVKLFLLCLVRSMEAVGDGKVWTVADVLLDVLEGSHCVFGTLALVGRSHHEKVKCLSDYGIEAGKKP
jgi:hypothetical protein